MRYTHAYSRYKRCSITLGIIFFIAGNVLISSNARAATDTNPVPADTTPPVQTYQYDRARILRITDVPPLANDGIPAKNIHIQFVSGPKQGSEMDIKSENDPNAPAPQLPFAVGQTAIIGHWTTSNGQDRYDIMDIYRIPALAWITAFFFALAILFARRKGFSSIIGLFLTILILGFYIIPRIASGQDPLITSLIGSLLITILSLYAAHGFNRETTIAFCSTLITLVITIIGALISVRFAALFGLGSEEAFYLQGLGQASLNLRGLLLAGIVLGTLGVLDDVTTGQTVAVKELARANPLLNYYELYKRGLIIGREHIASLVNTLVLAYAGASLPLFLLFTIHQTQPLWVIFNSEMIAQEVVRTLVGSSALILAVPITTFLASSYFASRTHYDQHRTPRKD